jgi:dihydroxyacetone kinase
MTSLNGLGFSITLLNVVNTDIGGPSMLELLDAPSEVPGWSAPIQKTSWEAKNTATREGTSSDVEHIKETGLTLDVESTKSALIDALDRVIAAEPEITKFDTVVGDGDCGIGLKRGAEGT